MSESFLDINFEDTYEPTVKAPGEYQVRCLKAEIRTSKNTGGEYVNLQLEIADDPEAKDIFHIMMLPTSNDDKKKANNRKMALLNAFKAFGIDPTGGINLAELEGQTGWAILDIEDDPEYGQKNRVKRFIAGA
jgi:hypothetical protein